MAKPGNHATVPGGQGKALAAQDKQLGLPISFRPSLVNKYFLQYNGAVGKTLPEAQRTQAFASIT